MIYQPKSQHKDSASANGAEQTAKTELTGAQWQADVAWPLTLCVKAFKWNLKPNSDNKIIKSRALSW